MRKILILIVFISLNVYAQTKRSNIKSVEPLNKFCEVNFNQASGKLQLSYGGKTILTAQIKTSAGKIAVDKNITKSTEAITQTLTISGKKMNLQGTINASNQAIAAETDGVSQKTFPLVRTTIGNPSVNFRNNAVYDRFSDCMLEIQCNNGVKIIPLKQLKNSTSFNFSCSDSKVKIVFRPLFYQKHKGVKYFKPWMYQIRKESITGWSSWWAYMRNCNEADINSLLAVWKEKQFEDFGYRYIQIDDVFQGGSDQGSRAPNIGPNGYFSSGPKTWLNWKKDIFPSGLGGYVQNVTKAGFSPAIWIGVNFSDLETTEKHPDWFVQDSTGKPYVGQWVSFAVDATKKQAVENLIRPTFKGLRDAGIKYVKIDLLRHYLYDNLHHNLKYCTARGYTPDEIFRSYLKVAREELGKETFILGCWGVLPQSVGFVDACRIGGDGYGPVTMQQYNSWNGIVWINDPDHCDVLPNFKPAEIGNVQNKSEVKSTHEETKLRPSLASIAGCMLILSDKPEVYKDDNILEGLRRASPVLPSVPGQLYDFDTTKTARLPKFISTDVKSGAGYSPLDADQFGPVCQWWLNEINRSFENWNVLSRVNWTKEQFPQTKVNFKDIGLDSKKEYLVFEFWNKKFLGVCKNYFEAANLKSNSIGTYSIREKTSHPQIVSTNRHITQGGADLVNVSWKNNILSGKSKVIKGDKYEVYFYIPTGFTLKTAIINGIEAQIKNEGIFIMSFVPDRTGEVNWEMTFSK